VNSVKNSVSNRHTLIKSYAVAGFRLFGCSKQKKPLAEGWRQTPVNENIDPSVLPACYGIALSEEDFVVDVDAYKFPEGKNYFKEMMDALGIPTPIDTYVVQSPRGGFHMYFKKPVNVANDLYMFAPGSDNTIEFKTAGRYTIGAGSVSSNGVYSVYKGDVFHIAHAPVQLLEFATRKMDMNTVDVEVLDQEVNIRNFYNYLVQHAPLAIENNAGNPTTYNVALRGRDLGLSEAVCLQLMELYYNLQKCQPPWSSEELEGIVHNAYSYAKNSIGNRTTAAQFELTPEIVAAAEQPTVAPTPKMQTPPKDIGDEYTVWDTPKIGNGAFVTKLPTLNNAALFFDIKEIRIKGGQMPDNPLRNLVRKNEFTGKIDFTRRAPWHTFDKQSWSSTDAVMMKHFCSKWYEFQAGKDLFEEAAEVHATMNAYHPVKEQIESVEWDGVARVDNLCPVYLGTVNSPYTREVGRVTILGLVKRIYEPGCQHDTTMIIEGIQGLLKSTFCRVLGGEFYGSLSKFDPKDKDTAIKLAGKWVVEIAEIDKITKRYSAEDLKDWLTTLVDNYRPPYEKHAIDQPRKCGFIGTINPNGAGYLSDLTGNRRFLPVLAEKINIAKLKEDRLQIFAEALHRLKNGEESYMTDPEILIEAQAHQSERVEQEPFIEIIGAWLTEHNRSVVQVSELAIALGLFGAKLDKREQGRISNALTQLGWKRKRETGGNRLWYWTKDLGV